ncbi:MAG: type IV toxin-antitoxin system AbiEi family antitoxin domain-containing protein [Bacteroidota bacterium]
MKTSDIVRNKINRFAKGYVFTYDDFEDEVKQADALKKVLQRMADSGEIKRLSKGRFYKPKEGITGTLNPDEYEIVKDLLEEDGKPIGYLTGLSIFNRFGLTTQVSNVIQIGSNVDKKNRKRGKYKIKFIRQWNPIRKDNIYLLQILDCIRFIKRIPDASVNESFQRILTLIKNLEEKDRKTLARLAQKYPPSARALTGAMLEKSGEDELAEKLFNTLRATTVFNINISDHLIENKEKWKIKNMPERHLFISTGRNEM